MWELVVVPRGEPEATVASNSSIKPSGVPTGKDLVCRGSQNTQFERLRDLLVQGIHRRERQWMYGSPGISCPSDNECPAPWRCSVSYAGRAGPLHFHRVERRMVFP